MILIFSYSGMTIQQTNKYKTIVHYANFTRFVNLSVKIQQADAILIV